MSDELLGWTSDPYADRWEEGFSQLVHYVERHGDVTPASQSPTRSMDTSSVHPQCVHLSASPARLTLPTPVGEYEHPLVVGDVDVTARTS